MPRSKMPDLKPMDIEPMEDGYLPQSEYLKKPEKPNALKSLQKGKRVEEPVEPVEKPVKKKRVMSEKQLAGLAKAREASAKKRKEKKLALEKPLITKTVKPVKPMATVDESSSDDEVMPSHEVPHIIQQKSTDSVEERVYQRIMAEKEQRRKVKEQKRNDERLARQYEESIREDERKKLYEMTQQVKPKKRQVNATAMLQPNKWEECFAPKKRNPFGF